MTKTLALAAAVLASLLTSPAFALDCDAGFRPFTHAAGETCIPEKPERIVATRGDSIATPLLDIGAPLVGAGFRTDNDETYLRGGADIFGMAFVVDAGVQSIGSPNEPDMEAIAALEPDLIILPGWQADLVEKASSIAPTVMIHDNLPFLDHLAILADAAGMSGVYEQRLAAYQAKIERIKTQLGHPSAITVSRFDISEGGLWFYPNWGAVDQVIDDIGFSRPAIQTDAAESRSDISFELLPEFDGDILLSSYAPRFGQTIAFLTTQWDEVAPFWRELDAVKAGNHYWYERDIWVGYTFKSLETAADGLLLLTQGRFDAGN
ncbi:MAG TPA: ABC transporter substrate-binding protein [Devosia sp.]|jgi:iron complex transport system substrate-binding protein|nr:ABC transporter substrate-binding protein [Devosia sp.]